MINRFPNLNSPQDPFKDFDKRFEKHMEEMNTVRRGVGVLSLIGFVLGLSLLVTLAYVAHHFIMKVW